MFSPIAVDQYVISPIEGKFDGACVIDYNQMEFSLRHILIRTQGGDISIIKEEISQFEGQLKKKWSSS
jgi:hypothetical protein